MSLSADDQRATETRVDVATFRAVIARSQILVARDAGCRRLPPGYDAVDAAILGWIAAEARRVRSQYRPL